MNQIEIITFGDGDDGRAVWSTSSAARILSIGNSWSRLRIGVRFAMSDSGANIVAPRLRIGVMSNPDSPLTNGPLSSSGHFWGLANSSGSNFTRNITASGPNAGNPQYQPGGMAALKRVNSTDTFVASGTTLIAAMPNATRHVAILELWKGTDASANWIIGAVLHNNVATLFDHSASWLESAMLADLGGGTIGTVLGNIRTALATASGIAASNYSNVTYSSTMTLDESVDGPLNAIVAAWDTSVAPIRISEFYFLSH